MNGDVLKKVFLIIVFTLCGIAILLTGAVLWGKFSINDYEKVMEIMGIPTIIGMIVTSFIHANIKDAPTDADIKKTTSITEGKNVQSNSTVLSTPISESGTPKV